MALVSYEFSDCSDFEDEDSSIKPSLNDQSLHKQTDVNSTCDEKPGHLFVSLPKPQRVIIKEEDDEFLHKESSVKKGKTKISIPSLSDFRDTEQIQTTKKYQEGNGKKSGLLSMLPEPKFGIKVSKSTTISFIPDVVKKKINSAPNDDVKYNSNKKTEQNLKSLLDTNYSDSEDELEESQSDFFSMKSKPEPITIEEINDEEITMKNIQNTSQISEALSENELEKDTFLYEKNTQNDTTNEISSFCETGNPTPVNSFDLDDEAMRQLCGSRKRQKKEDIEIINVDQQQVLADSREWLLKGLMDDTTKRISSSKRKGNEPTSQQKRKHQITYLAHQAKANEAELQNQWANSRMSKKQTQSKYGF